MQPGDATSHDQPWQERWWHSADATPDDQPWQPQPYDWQSGDAKLDDQAPKRRTPGPLPISIGSRPIGDWPSDVATSDDQPWHGHAHDWQGDNANELDDETGWNAAGWQEQETEDREGCGRRNSEDRVQSIANELVRNIVSAHEQSDA